MPSPTTLRGELLKAVKTFNDRFFLTMGSTGAGMTPYNPIQVGLGARLVIQTGRNVNTIDLTLSRIIDGASVNPNSLNAVKTGANTWEVEGAIGGARLGFPQPAPGYHIPQCFELRMVARNRAKVDEKIYTFWVGEGLVGTIAECPERDVIGTKPLIAGFDGLGWHEFAFPDNYAEFYTKNPLDPFVSNDDDTLKGLTPDPLGEHVYVEGDVSLWTELAYPLAPNNPFIRLPEPSPDPGFAYPLSPADNLFSLDALSGPAPSGSAWEFGAPDNVGAQFSLNNQDAWRVTPRGPYSPPMVRWIVSPVLDFKNYENAQVVFWHYSNLTSLGGIKLQWTDDEGGSWTDFAPGDYNVALTGGLTPLATEYGGADDGLTTGPLEKIVVDLSVLDGKPSVRVRWALATNATIAGDPYGPFISAITFFADPGETLCIARSMDNLRAGYDSAWSYARISDDEKWQHGTVQKAQRASAAAVHPTLGTGFVDDLVANPQVANDIGGNPGGPNIGFPRGIDGIRIEYVSGEDWGPGGSDDFIFDIVVDDWAPSTPIYHLLFGQAADWVGGANPGGFIELKVTQPAHLLCAIKPATAYYDALTGAVAWPAANTIGSAITLLKPGTTRITLRRSTTGHVFGDGIVFAVQVIAHTSSGQVSAGGTGYFTRLFPVDTIRSNALRLITVV